MTHHPNSTLGLGLTNNAKLSETTQMKVSNSQHENLLAA